MTRKLYVILVILSIGALAGLTILVSSSRTSYAAAKGVLLTGAVTSTSGGKIGGVTVSAKMDGSSITASVFTDEQGNYYFPPMDDGKYQLLAQAVGFEQSRSQVDLKGTVQHQDFVLKSTTDFFLQLSGNQMVDALPEDTPAHRRMKDVFIRNCTGCHEGNVPLQNRFDAQGWEAFINAMSRIEAYGSFRPEDAKPSATLQYFKKDLAAYLAEMRGPGPSPMILKAPPLPSGDAALPLVYEYDLPLEDGGGYVMANGTDWSKGASVSSGGGLGIHDAQADWNGNTWFTYNQAGSKERTVGKVDGKTGRVTNFKYPGENGLAATSHGIDIAHDGIIWFNVNTGAAAEEGTEIAGRLGRIDPRTGKFDVFTPPKGMAGIGGHVEEDGQGQIWCATGRGALRFNPKTQEFKEFISITQPGSSYGVAGDRDGNGWWTQISIDIIGHSDIETGKSMEIKLPPSTNSGSFLKPGDLTPEDLKMYGPRGTGVETPRRPSADKNGEDVWIPAYAGDNLFRINSHTLKLTTYPAPLVGVSPYMPETDNNHNVWMNLQGSDYVAKFDPTSEKWTFYNWPSRGTGTRGFHLLDRNGVLELDVAYFNANRVARMIMRSRKDVDTLKAEVQGMASAR